MFAFLSSFTPSFLIALLLWPFAALALTVPILILQYRHYNRLYALRAVGVYLFIFYVIGLVCFTLYPMPTDAVEFCRTYHLTPQLTSLQSIMDIKTDGMRAVLQVVMNVLFFVPLGVFLRVLWRVRIWKAIVLSFVASLCIETAQLTGVFGLYPCSYRLFDIDDLLVNTLGGVMGYVFGMLIPRRELDRVEKGSVVREPGLVRLSVSVVIDYACVLGVAFFVALLLYFFIGPDVSNSVKQMLVPISIVFIFGMLPLLCKGWSPGGAMTRLRHDEKPRGAAHKLWYYCVRTAFFLLLFTSTLVGLWFGWLLILVQLVLWKKLRKPLYQLA